MTTKKPTGADNGFNLANITAPKSVAPLPSPAERKRQKAAARSQKRRDKRHANGKTKVEVWVRPKHKAAIKQLEKELNQL